MNTGIFCVRLSRCFLIKKAEILPAMSLTVINKGFHHAKFEPLLPGPPLFRRHYRFRGIHIVISVVGTDDHDMFLRRSVRREWQRKVVAFRL